MFGSDSKTRVFKIRDTGTGLYSCGGAWPVRWSKTGKTWSSIGALRNHLNLVTDMGYSKPPRELPKNWEVVEIEVSHVAATALPATDYLKIKKA